MGGVLMFRSERMRQTGARSSASGTSSPMQSWADCITGTHESSYWKRQPHDIILSAACRVQFEIGIYSGVIAIGKPWCRPQIPIEQCEGHRISPNDVRQTYLI